MAQPGNVFSTTTHLDDYVAPYDRYKGELEDFEEGGIALNDGTQGLRVQMWHLTYDDDEESPTYGDFTLTAETTGESSVIINVPGVVRVGLAFNQNMDPFICYAKNDCTAWFYWFDPVPNDFVHTQLPAGAKHPACCLDDHRQTQTGTSSILLGYILSGNLEYRHQNDRFASVQDSAAVGAGVLHKVGMQKNMRIKWDVREGNGVRLSEIVGSLCERVGIGGGQIDVGELYPITVRGWKSAGMYNAADAIRGLQLVYFFDFPMIDGKLTAVRRGGAVAATITQDDLVSDREFLFEDAREQGVEFPLKLHLGHANAETDYTPTKATSERRSRDIRSMREDSVESAVNHTPQDAAERADIIHKVMWAQFEGRAKFSITEAFAQLVPSCLINLEVRTGVYRRMLITRMTRVDGVMDCEAVRDRQSAYTAGSITLPAIVPAEAPPVTIPGSTTWEFMDLPALLTSHDAVMPYYVAGRGDAGTAWHGAQLQREVGADWLKEADIPSAEMMGQLEEATGYGSRYVPDTTNTILVSLNRAPSSISNDLLYKGKGAWVIGDEIIQVRDWAAEGANWRGSHLLRGRLDTTPVAHSSAERAVFLGNPVVVPADPSLRDTTLSLRAPSYDEAVADATEYDYAFAGKSQEEWAPIDLVSTMDIPASSDWTFSWTPRYRLGSSANPIPSAQFYAWRIRFTVGAAVVTKTTTGTTPSYVYTSADQTTDFGSAQSSFDTVEVRALNFLGGEGKALSEAVP